MNKNERKHLFFNKKIVMITAAIIMMGQVCFMPKIAQNKVMAIKPPQPPIQQNYNNFKEVYINEEAFENNKDIEKLENNIDYFNRTLNSVVPVIQYDGNYSSYDTYSDEEKKSSTEVWDMFDKIIKKKQQEFKDELQINNPQQYFKTFIELKSASYLGYAIKLPADKQRFTQEFGYTNRFQISKAINFVLNGEALQYLNKNKQDFGNYQDIAKEIQSLMANMKACIAQIKALKSQGKSCDKEKVNYHKVRLADNAMKLAVKLAIVKRFAAMNFGLVYAVRQTNKLEIANDSPTRLTSGVVDKLDYVMRNMQGVFYKTMMGYIDEIYDAVVAMVVEIEDDKGTKANDAKSIYENILQMLGFNDKMQDVYATGKGIAALGIDKLASVAVRDSINNVFVLPGVDLSNYKGLRKKDVPKNVVGGHYRYFGYTNLPVAPAADIFTAQMSPNAGAGGPVAPNIKTWVPLYTEADINSLNDPEYAKLRDKIADVIKADFSGIGAAKNYLIKIAVENFREIFALAKIYQLASGDSEIAASFAGTNLNNIKDGTTGLLSDLNADLFNGHMALDKKFSLLQDILLNKKDQVEPYVALYNTAAPINSVKATFTVGANMHARKLTNKDIAATMVMLLRSYLVKYGNYDYYSKNNPLPEGAYINDVLTTYGINMKFYLNERSLVYNLNDPQVPNVAVNTNQQKDKINVKEFGYGIINILASRMMQIYRIDKEKVAKNYLAAKMACGWDLKVAQGMYQIFFQPDENGVIRPAGTYYAGTLSQNEIEWLKGTFAASIVNYLMILNARKKDGIKTKQLCAFNDNFEITEGGSDDDKNKQNNISGIKIRNININTLKSYLDNIVEMTDGLRLYYLNGDNGSGRRLAISLLFSFYKLIHELNDENFNGNPVKKPEFEATILNKIVGMLNYSDGTSEYKELKEALVRLRKKETKYEDCIRIFKAFIFIDAEEEKRITGALTGNIGLESFASIVKRIISSNSPEVKKIVKEGFKKLIKSMSNENNKSITGVSGIYLTPVLENITDMIMYERNKMYNIAYDGFVEKLRTDKSVDKSYRDIFDQVTRDEGVGTRIDFVNNIMEMASFAKSTADEFKRMKASGEKTRENNDYNSFYFGNNNYGFSFGIQNVQTAFFDSAEQLWRNFSDDLNEYIKMLNEKDKIKESDALGKKLRDILYKHIERVMSLFSMFVRLWEEEQNEWKNFLELTGANKEGASEKYVHVKMRDAIHHLMLEIAKCMRCGSLIDFNGMINRVGDNSFGSLYYGRGNTTETMENAIKNIQILLQDLAKDNKNSDFIRQATVSVQKMLLYQVIQYVFCKNFFSKEYTVRNFNFETGKAIKNETELNKDVDIAFNEEQIPATNIKELMFNMIKKAIEENIYTGLYNVFNSDYGWNGAYNKIDLLKTKMNSFMETSNPIYENLMKYYNGEKLTETEKSADDSKESEEPEDKEDKKAKKAKKEKVKEKEEKENTPKGPVAKIITDSEGWMYVTPFKDKNLEASEGTIRFKIDYKERKVHIEAFGFNLPSTGFRIVIKTILNGKVIDEPTVMVANGNKYVAVVNLPEDPKNRVGMHLYIKEDGDKTPVSQVEGKNFICGIDLLNLTDLKAALEQVIKTTKATKGEFHNGDKSLLKDAPKMTLYKLGNKILVMMEGLQENGKNDVATVLPSGNKQLNQGENRYTMTSIESIPNVCFFVIEDNIVSQIGEKFSIHFHKGKQDEKTFKYYAEVDFNKAEELSEAKEKGKEEENVKDEEAAPKAKANKLQVETEEDKEEEDNSGEETEAEDEDEDVDTNDDVDKKLKTKKKSGKKKKNDENGEEDDEDDEESKKKDLEARGLVDFDNESKNKNGLKKPYFPYF